MIKVGVIGYGYAAQTFHLPLIQATENLKLSAISSSKADVVKTRFPSLTVYDTADELIAHSEVDLVVITAPNQAHFALVKSCLEHKLHVVIEKPMVTSSVDAEQLMRFANKQGCFLSVFHNRRWDGDFLTVKKLIESQSVGEVRLFESHFDRYRPLVRQRWREQPGEGTGIWFDLGPHLVEQALHLFGWPEAITARCLTLRENAKTTDYFHVLLHYKGLEVILHASSFSAGLNRRFQLEGTAGSYTKYGFDVQEEQLKAGISPLAQEFGYDAVENDGTLYTEREQQRVKTERGCYQHYYTAVAEAITLGQPNPVSAEDALKVIRVLELAEQSSQRATTVQLAER